MSHKLFYFFGILLMLAWVAGLIVFTFGSFLQLLVILFMIEIIMGLIKKRKPAHHRK
jgi:hypothetical protein